MRILLVEDDIPLGEAVVSALTEKGHEVTLLMCLREGIMSVRCNLEGFDVIVTDVQLPIYPETENPVGSGLDIVRELSRMGCVEKPLYVHSSDTMDHGINIAKWLAEKYPTGVFEKKSWDVGATVQKVVDYVNSQST